MNEREVSEDEVEEAAQTPDLSEASIKGRTNSYKFINGRYLRVTLKEGSDHLLVITVTIRKKPFRG